MQHLRRISHGLLTALLVSLPLLAEASSGLWEVAPEPEWVRPVDVTIPAEVPTRDLQNGIFNLLMDSQVQVEPRAFYYHVARLLVDATGVQNGSRIQIAIDPTYERIRLHRLDVLREGVRLDRLGDLEVRELTREPGLESHMLNGRVTFVIDVKDTRAGDVLDYSFSVSGENPVYAGHFGESWFVGSDVPIAEQRLRVVIPAGRTVRFRAFGLDEPRDFSAESDRQWIWKNPAMVEGEESTPGWAVVWPFLQASDLASWADVAEWALPIYSFDQELPVELEARIAEWKQLGSDELRLLTALRWVQTEVRYLGQMMGIHSHKPRAAKLVCEQKFGDCKEKTVVLGAILERMGIKSFPILVNSRMRRGISDLLPSVDAFDHVILGVEWDGGVLFLDPTRDEQKGGIGELGLGAFGLGLAVRPGERNLMVVEPPAGARRVTEVDEVFTLESMKAGGRLSVKTVVRGGAAEHLRSSLLNSGSKQTEKSYREYYGRFFPGLTVAERLRVEETPGANELTITEEYEFPVAFQNDASGAGTLELPAADLLSYLTTPVATERNFPLEIQHPVSYRQRTSVLLPEGFNIDAKHVDIDNDFFRLQVSSAPGPQRFEMTRRYETKADSVPPERFNEWREDIRRAREASIQSFTNAPEATSSPTVAAKAPFNVLVLFALMVGGAGAVVILGVGWWRVAKLKNRVLPPSFDHRRLEGITGWLILPAIGLPLTFIGSALTIAGSFKNLIFYPLSDMVATFGGAHTAGLLLQFAIAVSYVGLVGLALVLFFRKSQLAPKVVPAVFLVSVVICSLDLVLSVGAPWSWEAKSTAVYAEFGTSLIKAAIWVPYFQVSKRVKATFRW